MKNAGKSKAACLVEYAALRIVCAAAGAVPYCMVRHLASAAAFAAFRVFGFKRARTLSRIRAVFPGISASDASRIAVESLSNLLQIALEMARAPRIGRKWIDRRVRDIAVYAERLRGYVEEGKGVVIMVPHSGNWYMAAWAMARHGLPMFAVAARQRNPYINAWMGRLYGDGVDVLERGSARTMREICDRLSRGQAFAILPDLRVMSPDVETPFLNGVANVSHGGAAFAVRTGSPVVVAAMRREGGMHVMDHLGTIRPDPAAADRGEEARRITREAMALIDAAVKRHPGQWFWFNKRWILEPVNRGVRRRG